MYAVCVKKDCLLHNHIQSSRVRNDNPLRQKKCAFSLQTRSELEHKKWKSGLEAILVSQRGGRDKKVTIILFLHLPFDHIFENVMETDTQKVPIRTESILFIETDFKESLSIFAYWI